MKLPICAFLFTVALAGQASAADELLTREIPWGQGVRLAEFGGPDLEVCVRTREMTHVVAEIIDYMRLVPVARANLQGYVDTRMVPMKTTLRVEKKHGTPVPGGRHEMYLLFHEPETGIRVFFLDSIARQNHDNVVIALPK